MRVFVLDPLDHLASFRMTRHDRVGLPRTFPERSLFQIEPQISLPRCRIWPMATKAIARQDRLHVLIEVKVLR
jgi:hypothetical protein